MARPLCRFAATCAVVVLALATTRTGAQSTSSSALSGSQACSSDTVFAQLLPPPSCDSVCGSGDLCVAVNASAPTTNSSTIADACNASTTEVECVSVTTNDSLSLCEFLCLAQPTSEFVLLVPLGEYESAEEAEVRALYGETRVDKALATLPDDTNLYPSVSNDLVQTVGVLTLDSGVSTVRIAGGKTYETYQYIQGFVAQLDFADGFLASQTQIVQVQLASLDMNSTVSRLPTLLPSSLITLWIDNALLYEFPSNLEAAFPKLQGLSLAHNNFTTVNSSITFASLELLSLTANNLVSIEATLPSLQELYLSYNLFTAIPVLDQFPALFLLYMASNLIENVNVSSDTLIYLNLIGNNVSSFTAEYPLLEELYLDNNSLSEIPTSIYNSTNLRILTLEGNNLTLTFTSAQLAFLKRLETLNISSSANASDTFVGCNSTQLLQNISVCVIDYGTDATVDVSSQSHSNHLPIIVGGVVGGMVVAILIAVYAYQRHSRNAKRLGERGGGGMDTLWDDRELVALQLDADAIEDIKQLGSGAFGVVWLVRYRGERLLASKRLIADVVTRERTLDFIKEIKLMAQFNHHNVVALVGVAWTHQADLQALTEFVDNGDLRDYLLQSTHFEWSASKIGIAIGIVDALAYVHSFLPPIVHRDLKSRNVLLTSDLTAKVTDFGASREQSANATMTLGVGTGRWQAPEVLSGSQDYDYRADIYSFGVILAELDSHLLPYEDARGPSGEPLVEVAILHLVAMGQLRPSLSPSCPRAVRDLADRCMAQDPKRRPAAVECAYKLRVALKALAK